MAWRRPSDKPLSELMMVSLPTHKCVTRPQWVNNVSFIPRTLYTYLGLTHIRRLCKFPLFIPFPYPPNTSLPNPRNGINRQGKFRHLDIVLLGYLTRAMLFFRVNFDQNNDRLQRCIATVFPDVVWHCLWENCRKSSRYITLIWNVPPLITAAYPRDNEFNKTFDTLIDCREVQAN